MRLLAIVIAALLIAGSILFIGRYQITAVGFGIAGDGERRADGGEEKVFRLDRWTGEIEICAIGGSDIPGFASRIAQTGHAIFTCAVPKEAASPPRPSGPPSE